MLTHQNSSGTLSTPDKIHIAYDHLKNGFESIIIICPGFFNSRKNRWMRKTVDLISTAYDSIIFDFRGHGDSTGKFSWTAKEHLDVQTVLDYTKSQGYKDIGILAFSLGAAASINAVSVRADVRSMVLISCLCKFSEINYHFWEPEMFSDLKDNIECNWEGKGARTSHIFLAKPKPIKTISKIKDVPILFIHGNKDWIIKDYHSQKLYDAATTYKKIEIIKTGLHAERLVQQYPDKMKNLVLNWFAKTMKQGGAN